MCVIHREPPSRIWRLISRDGSGDPLGSQGDPRIHQGSNIYIYRKVPCLLEPYVQLNTVSSYILVTHSLTVLDLPLSVPPPSQEYPYLGTPTLETQLNTTVTLLYCCYTLYSIPASIWYNSSCSIYSLLYLNSLNRLAAAYCSSWYLVYS
jgi:hypothetical protein